MKEIIDKDAAPPPAACFRSDLLRRAAEAGPGYRGRRTALSAESLKGLTEEITASGDIVPAYLTGAANWVDRRAKLFEAGDFPDKGVTVSETDLRALADGFDLPVPVLIEHAHSPLELGYLTQVEARGGELFGTVALTEEANALVERSGAKSLSLGLSKNLERIQEVSLVRKPRVKSAKLFREGVCFWAELEGTYDVRRTNENADVPFLMDGTNWKRRYDELAGDIEREKAARQVSELVKDGRLLPSQAPFAAALLQSGGTIEFDGENRPVHQLLIAILERQPPHGLFGELAPASPNSSEALFLPEEAAFYRKHFPDVSLDVIAARRASR